MPRKVKNRHSPGPDLVSYALWLIREHGMTNKQVKERWGLGGAWLSGIERGHTKTPNASTIQRIIQDLTGIEIVEAVESVRLEKAPTFEAKD